MVLLKLYGFVFALILSTHVYSNVSLDGSGRGGSSGKSGANGTWYGDYGREGEDGRSGAHGQPVNVILADENGELKIIGSVGQTLINESTSQYGKKIFISTRGGNGGSGGNGGDGYQGKDGQDGVDGRNGRTGPTGRNGRDGTRYSPNGEDGYDGGRGSDGENGTDGQDGTNGGNGGNGGDGGSGGNGANIIVKYKDPAVLMHVSADYASGRGGSAGSYGSGGRKGLGGSRGEGGDGGSGGWGGSGGRGYRCSEQERLNGCVDGHDGRNGNRGWSGSDGRDGQRGSDGYSGSNGSSGSSGYRGRSGSLAFVKLDENNNPVPGSETSEIYEPVVTNFKVIDENDDSIVEPGEKLFISNIVIKNLNQMDLPAGSIVEVIGEDLIGKISYTLPAIKGKGEFIINETFEMMIPEHLKVNDQIEISSSIEFRGINFNNDHFQKSFKLQRPIVVRKVEYKKYTPFARAQTGVIELENISTKAHNKINVAYVNEGHFILNILKDVESIPAGTQVSETFELTAPDTLDAYETSSILYSLSRNNVDYEKGKIQNQVIPSYVFKNSEILVVSNGHDTESYKAIVKALGDLRLGYDIFDINLEGNLTTEILDKYHTKTVVFTNFENQFISSVESAFNEFLKTTSGVFTVGLHKTLSPTHYTHRFLNADVDYYKLSFTEMAEVVKKGTLSVLAFNKKQELFSKYFFSSEQEMYKIYRDAYIKDIKDEYLLFKQDGDIYDVNPYIDRYQKYTLALSPIIQYDLRMDLIKMVEEFSKFDDNTNLKFVRFKKHFKQVKEFFDDLDNLIEKCGEIKGVYQDDENHIIQIYKYSLLGGLRAETQDLFYEFRKGKEVEKNIWDFIYNIGNGENNDVRFTLTCNNGVTKLSGTKSHGDGGDWTLVKIFSKRMWNNEQP